MLLVLLAVVGGSTSFDEGVRSEGIRVQTPVAALVAHIVGGRGIPFLNGRHCTCEDLSISLSREILS